jgi:hypothetical protein
MVSDIFFSAIFAILRAKMLKKEPDGAPSSST